MKPAAARMDFVTFSRLDVVGRDVTAADREAPQSASGGSLVADLRYVCVARFATRLPHAPQQCAGICVKDGVCHGPGILLKAGADPDSNSSAPVSSVLLRGDLGMGAASAKSELG